MKRFALVIATIGTAAVLAGCETPSSSGGDPGARPLPSGQSCQSLRAELNKMDSQGAQGKVERARSGKVDPATQAVADRYNQLLNWYLGARCHV
jgi:ABC-type phosphate transport system substrate-binding protein